MKVKHYLPHLTWLVILLVAFAVGVITDNALFAFFFNDILTAMFDPFQLIVIFVLAFSLQRMRFYIPALLTFGIVVLILRDRFGSEVTIAGAIGGVLTVGFALHAIVYRFRPYVQKTPSSSE